MVATTGTPETTFTPPPPIVLAEELRMVLEGQALFSSLSGNGRVRARTRGAAFVRANATRYCKQAIGEAVEKALKEWGNRPHKVIPEEFLTRGGKRPVMEAFPLKVEFIRYYAGHSKEYDDDNLPPTWKGYRDGLMAALNIAAYTGKGQDDTRKYFKPTYRQIRTKNRHALEIVVKLGQGLGMTQEGATEAQEGGKEA